MYCDYFGFKKDPFGPEFDADFLFQGKSWVSVYGRLANKIQGNREILLLTGERGIGKSYLLMTLAYRLESKAKFIHQTIESINFNDFIEKLCNQFALNTNNKDLLQKTQLVNGYLESHPNVNIVLVIEDVHLAGDSLLEKIKPVLIPLMQQPIAFQLVLTGQSELQNNYQSLSSGEADTPTVERYTLEPLKELECSTYILRRLRSVGNVSLELFPQSTLDLVWKFTHGVPGTVNNLCTAALKSALNSGQKTITTELIRKIAGIGFDWHPERLTNIETPMPAANIDSVQPDRREKAPQESPRQKLRGDEPKRQSLRYSEVGLGVFLLLYLLLFYLTVVDTTSEQNTVVQANSTNEATTQQQTDEKDQIDFGLAEFYPQQWTKPIATAESADSSTSETEEQIVVGTATIEKESPKTTTETAINSSAPKTVEPKENARQYIQRIQTYGADVNLDDVFKMAQTMSIQNRHSEAYLVYFYAANLGHANSAFELAQLSDPATFNPELKIVNAPDLTQAYKWYMKATSEGHPQAKQALNRLRTNLKKQADAGDKIAQRWILQWD